MIDTVIVDNNRFPELADLPSLEFQRFARKHGETSPKWRRTVTGYCRSVLEAITKLSFLKVGGSSGGKQNRSRCVIHRSQTGFEPLDLKSAWFAQF
jgi:hypothetical protein